MVQGLQNHQRNSENGNFLKDGIVVNDLVLPKRKVGAAFQIVGNSLLMHMVSGCAVLVQIQAVQ